MSLKHMEPEGFNEDMRNYARWTRPARMYAQGIGIKDAAMWLSIDGFQTAIGYGDPDAALAEAQEWAAHQLADLRLQVEEIKRWRKEKGGSV